MDPFHMGLVLGFLGGLFVAAMLGIAYVAGFFDVDSALNLPPPK